MDRNFDTASQKLQQNSNSIGGRQKSCHDSFETLKRSFRNLYSLADLKRTIERNDLIAGSTERIERCRFDYRHMVPKANQSRDAVRMNHSPVKLCVNKFREQVTRKHRFHEPDRPAAGQFPEPNTRGDNRHQELATKSCSR